MRHDNDAPGVTDIVQVQSLTQPFYHNLWLWRICFTTIAGIAASIGPQMHATVACVQSDEAPMVAEPSSIVGLLPRVCVAMIDQAIHSIDLLMIASP